MKDEQKTNFKLVLRFTHSQNVVSIQIPLTWTVKKLKNFINYAYKDEIKYRKNVNLYCRGKLLNFTNDENTILFNLFPNNDEIKQIIVNIKNREDELDNTKNTSDQPVNNSEATRNEIVINFFKNYSLLKMNLKN